MLNDTALVRRADQPVTPRAEVHAYAEEMERQLCANAHKGTWKHSDPRALLQEIIYHVEKLTSAETIDLIGEYAADVGNLCMMYADVCGALAIPTAHEQAAWLGDLPPEAYVAWAVAAAEEADEEEYQHADLS